jgi:hypothetical protein
MTAVLRIRRDGYAPSLFHISWRANVGSVHYLAETMVHEAVIRDRVMRRIAVRNVRRQLGVRMLEAIDEGIVNSVVKGWISL